MFSPDPPDIPHGISLRTELSLRGLRYAAANKLLHERTDGSVPGVLFGRSEDGCHGNFHPLSYKQICDNPEWSRRLEKSHTAYRRSRARANWQWKELDCAHSSDALLMSIFCHPAVLASNAVLALLGLSSNASPVFGHKPRTPLANSRSDNTEIDMKLGHLLVEAKLTESDFQSARLALLTRYRDFETVFGAATLPLTNDIYRGYQLIRGTLAAHATGDSFCVFCDARRPDLIEGWYQIMRAVRLFDLRCRLKLLTWQELSTALPADLQQFLAAKYGILPA